MNALYLIFTMMSLVIGLLAIVLFNALTYAKHLRDTNHDLMVRLNEALNTIENIKYGNKLRNVRVKV